MDMTILMFLIFSIFLNIIFIKYLSTKNSELLTSKEKETEAKKDYEILYVESEKNKDVYSSERKSLISENKSLQIEVDDLKNKLEEFTDKKLAYYSEMDNLNNSAKEMTPEELLELRDKSKDKNSNVHDFTGIYVLENKTWDKYYVGQSISVIKRVSSHFTGKGNKDIYEDYSNGEEWTIKVIALSNTGFKSINALEKHFIEYHKSTYNGYNRTIGNVN